MPFSLLWKGNTNFCTWCVNLWDMSWATEGCFALQLRLSFLLTAWCVDWITTFSNPYEMLLWTGCNYTDFIYTVVAKKKICLHYLCIWEHTHVLTIVKTGQLIPLNKNNSQTSLGLSCSVFIREATEKAKFFLRKPAGILTASKCSGAFWRGHLLIMERPRVLSKHWPLHRCRVGFPKP